MRSLAIALLASAWAAPGLAAEPSRTAPSSEADTAQSGERTPTMVESVWRLTDDGAGEHLQSGLQCPASVEGFRRAQMFVLDDYGIEAGCNYLSRGRAFTIRVAPLGDKTAAEIMEVARKEMITAATTRAPVLLTAEQVTDGGLAWTVERYDLDGGRTSEIWLAETSGWRVRYRVTYTADGGGRPDALLKATNARVATSAVPTLAACAKAEAVVRKGKPVKDRKQAEEDALMSGILGGALMSAIKEAEAKGEAEKPETAPQPVVWCPIQTSDRDGVRSIYWRSVRMDGADALAEKITLVTRGPPPTLSIAVDGMAQLLGNEPGRAPKWAASITQGDRVTIYGYFDDRPKIEDGLALLDKIVAGKAKPVGGYSAKPGASINIFMPPK